MRSKPEIGILLVASLMRLASAQTPQAATDEFLLGTAGSNIPESPDVAATGSGFVTAWEEANDALSSITIVGRRLSSSGAFQGETFRVESDPSQSVTRAAIAAQSGGRFAVSYENSSESSEIRSRIFLPDARAIQLAAGLNTQTTGQQMISDIAALPSGGWVVTWADTNSGAQRVVARLLDPDGTPSGAEIPVSTNASFNGVNVRVATSAAGPFAVTWSSDGDDGDRGGVMARVFSATGSPLTAEFVVNDFTAGDQGGAIVEALKDGSFVAAWSGPNAEGSTGISMQRFTTAGAHIGSQAVVSDSTSTAQIQPRIAALDDSGWIIVWGSFGSDGSGFGIVGRRFDENGSPLGEEFAVNQITEGSQDIGGVAALGNALLVVWTSNDGGSQADEIVVGRLFSLPSTASQPQPDTAPPVVKVRGGKRLSTTKSRTVVQGTAIDDSALASVLVSVNGSTFKPAKGAASWKATVSLKKGINIVRIKAVDTSGKASAPAVVSITRKPGR